jgi:hypothetical protein
MCQLTGDILFCAPDEDRWAHYQHLAKVQGNFVNVSVLKELSTQELLACILPPGQSKIYEEYMELKSEYSSLGGAFVADLDHHPNTASSQGPDWPCQLTHGTVVAFGNTEAEKPRIATPLEHLSAQGFHLFEGATTLDFPATKLASVLSSLSGQAAKKMAGNGMHLAIVCSWMFFVLSNVQRVPRSADAASEQPLPSSPSQVKEEVGSDTL